MSAIHMVLGIAVLAANALAATWGVIAWSRKRPSVAFWPMLRLAQAVVAAQVVLGMILLARGEHAPDGLHLAYGIAPLVVTLVSEAMRVGAAQRELESIDDVEALDHPKQVAVARRVALSEMGVMTVGLLLVLTLSLRAYQTGG